MMEPDRWLGLDLRHLVALKTIADEGSFGKAAEKLGKVAQEHGVVIVAS